MVAMDLHQLGDNLWYLHFMDEFSRFNNGVFIKSKQSNIIIQNFLKHWISIFGTPVSVFSDNGGEFASEDVIDFCKNFGIKIKQQQQNHLGAMAFVSAIMQLLQVH